LNGQADEPQQKALHKEHAVQAAQAKTLTAGLEHVCIASILAFSTLTKRQVGGEPQGP